MDPFKKHKYYSSPMDSDSEDEHKSKSKKFVIQYLALVRPEIFSGRLPNSRKDRNFAIEFIHSWNDVMFNRQFRFDRPTFYNIVRELEERQQQLHRQRHHRSQQQQ